MFKRALSSQGPAVSAIGLGTMGLSGSYGPADEREAITAVRQALAAGVTFVDTADFYGSGKSEELVGRAAAGHRDEIVIATKTGMRVRSDRRDPGATGLGAIGSVVLCR